MDTLANQSLKVLIEAIFRMKQKKSIRMIAETLQVYITL